MDFLGRGAQCRPASGDMPAGVLLPNNSSKWRPAALKLMETRAWSKGNGKLLGIFELS
jgi:hypothetical protein